MTRLKSALKELLGLFVDDGPFTLGIVAWLAFAGLIFTRVLGHPRLLASIFVLGLLAALLASVWRTAKRPR